MAEIPTDEVGDIGRRYPSRDSRRHIHKEDEDEDEDDEEEEEEEQDNSNSKSQLKPYEKSSLRDQERQAKGQIRTGTWTKEENMAFLHGVRTCGKGNWSIIAENFIPTRTTRQVKSKAQTESKLHGKNSGNYSELDEYLKEHPDFYKSQLKPYEKNSLRDQERRAKGQIRTGTWTKEESMAFLHGVRTCGKGNWSIIAENFIPTRTTRQVKSKAHIESKLHGENSGNYSELDEYLKEHPDFWKNMKTESDAVTATSLSSASASASTKKPTSTSTVIGKIIYAIRQLNEPGLKGPSRQSIIKYIKSEFNNYDKTTALKKAFKKAVTGVDKILIQNGQSFRVIGDPIIESEPQMKSTTRTKMNKKLSNHKISTQAKISSQKSSKKQNKNKENGVTGAGGAGDDGTTTGASVVGGDGDEDVFYDAVQELNE